MPTPDPRWKQVGAELANGARTQAAEEVRNLADLGVALIDVALARRESRGVTPARTSPTDSTTSECDCSSAADRPATGRPDHQVVTSSSRRACGLPRHGQEWHHARTSRRLRITFQHWRFVPPSNDALAEDLTPLGDLTSDHRCPLARSPPPSFAPGEPGVLAGVDCVIETFAQVDPSLTLTWRLSDGDRLEAGSVIGTVEGHLRTVLTAERTALNFLSHLSGVATNTAAFVDRAAATGSSTRVWDTRKTTPGLRSLQKAAVRAGGRRNHRANLSGAIMVKDNHLTGLGVAEAVGLAKDRWPNRTVVVECERSDQMVVAIRSRCRFGAARQHDAGAGLRVRGAGGRVTGLLAPPLPAGGVRCHHPGNGGRVRRHRCRPGVLRGDHQLGPGARYRPR